MLASQINKACPLQTNSSPELLPPALLCLDARFWGCGRRRLHATQHRNHCAEDGFARLVKRPESSEHLMLSVMPIGMGARDAEDCASR
jgi:hypothetical protein